MDKQQRAAALSSERFQNALRAKPQSTPPIWFMRQAGRYHEHYQQMKKKHTFVELCKNPELAAEVALGPIRDFDFDVSIMFSDLLFPLESLGFGLEYSPGPVLDKKLTPEVLKNLKPLEEAIEGVMFQKQVALATKEMLPKDKSLIGFVGGPWTLFTYAIEGSHKALMCEVKNDMDLFEAFCERLIPFLIKNIQLQLDGGVELVMIFDTAAGELSPGMYNQYIVPQLEKMINAHKGKLGYYGQKLTDDHLAPKIKSQSSLVGIGVDHRFQISRVLQQRKSGFIQGNFDQTLLFAPSETFKKYLLEYLAPLKELTNEQRAGWVCGLGHGVLPKTPENNVRDFVQIIRKEFS